MSKTIAEIILHAISLIIVFALVTAFRIIPFNTALGAAVGMILIDILAFLAMKIYQKVKNSKN